LRERRGSGRVRATSHRRPECHAAVLSSPCCCAGLCAAQAAEYTSTRATPTPASKSTTSAFRPSAACSTRAAALEFDPRQAGRIDITIDTASLDTGFALRDEVCAATLVQRQGLPDILFRSQSLVFTDNQLSAVEGR
jgi:polyisoprenoid-binding protein YceI